MHLGNFMALLDCLTESSRIGQGIYPIPVSDDSKCYSGEVQCGLARSRANPL